MNVARDIVTGHSTPIEGAKVIADLGTRDCYDFMHEGIDVVDEMAEFFAFVHDWELRQDSAAAKDEISEEIREAARKFVEEFAAS